MLMVRREENDSNPILWCSVMIGRSSHGLICRITPYLGTFFCLIMDVANKCEGTCSCTLKRRGDRSV